MASWSSNVPMLLMITLQINTQSRYGKIWDIYTQDNESIGCFSRSPKAWKFTHVCYCYRDFKEVFVEERKL